MTTTTHQSVTLTKRTGDEEITAVAALYTVGDNPTAHFSLTSTTCEIRGNGRRIEVGGGAAHEEILAAFPELAPIAALHLAEEDGTPLYAAENGAFHLGFSDHADGVDYAAFARLWRVDEQHAREARREILRSAFNVPEHEAYKHAVAELQVLARSMRSRWQAEADDGKALIVRLAEEQGR